MISDPRGPDDAAAPGGPTDELCALYERWGRILADNPAMSIAQMRTLFDHWGDVTAEPRAVDYSETDIDGMAAMWITPHRATMDAVLLCIHGGGYATGSIYSHRKLYGHFAKAAGCRALAIDYRLAPENPSPAAAEDCVAAYRWLLEDEHVSPARIAIVGDSAGGALAIATMLRARERGLPLPAAAVALSPWLDLLNAGESYRTNAEFDRLVKREVSDAMARMVAGPGDIRDRLLNPSDPKLLAGLPPILIQVSRDECLYDDSRAFVECAKEAGVEVSLDVSDGMQHVFHFLAGSPVADLAIKRAGLWLGERLSISRNRFS